VTIDLFAKRVLSEGVFALQNDRISGGIYVEIAVLTPLAHFSIKLASGCVRTYSRADTAVAIHDSVLTERLGLHRKAHCTAMAVSFVHRESILDFPGIIWNIRGLVSRFQGQAIDRLLF